MKTEISWKRRFLRKKLKYMLLCVCIATVVFFIHQLFYYKELNQVIVGKLIAGSVRTSHYAVSNEVDSKGNESHHFKSLYDKDGQTVSLRGVHSRDTSKYLPNRRGKFICFASKIEIDFNKVNDDYCDCPLDGSDEPGTSACKNGVFNCQISSSKFAVKIPSYKVGDGFCDCCDGSDEWIETSKLHRTNESGKIANHHIKCQNKC